MTGKKKAKASKQVEFIKLFVYGTLMTGCKLHGWLSSNKKLARKISDGSIGGYSLLDFGPYPALINCGEDFGGSVVGELWEVHPALFAELKEMEERVGYSTEDVEVSGLGAKVWEAVEAKAFVFATFDPYATVKWNLKAEDNPRTTPHIIKV